MRRDEHLNYVCADCGNPEFPHMWLHPFVPEVYEAPSPAAEVFVDPVLTKISLDCMTGKTDWDRRFLELARHVSTWSKDPSTKVGAIIVRDRHVKATGYNGFPKGISDDERLDDREQKYPRVVHAEVNACIQAGHEARGATMYMFFPGGGPPCIECTKVVITSGITRLVIAKGEKCERWHDNQEVGGQILREAGVEIVEMEL